MSADAERVTVDRRDLANAVRALSMDAVQRANSGHPGMPMGMADIAEVLWNDFLRYNPANPMWPDRDRFILSNGHGSMLHYSLLHLAGYDLPIEELMNFRQLHSKTPGHPEYGHAPGVETTTGPLGQGIANAVGMAMAEKILGAHFNRDGLPIVDHYVYAFVGDGCLMEGVSHEACSFAGTHGLAKLILFWDDNGVSIDGDVAGWFTDDTPRRFEAYGWQVVRDVDGHDAQAVGKAIEAARADDERPSLICCKTVIGWGAPNKQGKAASHGAALGEDEVALVRDTINWPHDPFVVPDEIYSAWDGRGRGAAAESEWQGRLAAYRRAHPQLAAEFERRMALRLPEDWPQNRDEFLQTLVDHDKSVATRKLSAQVLDTFAACVPEMVGGSADLTESNNTLWSGSKPITTGDADGNYLYYGVREFAMAAMANGMALHRGVIPYAGTFLVFSDYARNAIRMAALMGVRSIFVFTHDSIGLGEDGPTHQPIEHTTSLRLIPGLSVWRPCDLLETAVAWQAAIEREDGPTAVLLTRQAVPPQAHDATHVQAVRRGAYTLVDADGDPEAIVIATGSEVDLAVQAAARFGGRVRVVSMPSADTFDSQDAAYREQVLPARIRRRVAVEAGTGLGWHRYVGLDGRVIGIERFGESAPAAQVFEHLGVTVDAVVAAIDEMLHNK